MVNVVEHHDSKEHAEDHAVHMVELCRRQELHFLDEQANGNQDKDGHHRAHGNDKIAENCRIHR